MHQVAECCRLGWLVSELTLWWKMTIRWRQQWYLFRRFAEQLPTVQTQFLEKVSFGNESCKAQSDRSCRLAKSRWAARPLQHNPMQWLFKLHIGNCRNSIFTFCWRAFFAWYAAVLRVLRCTRKTPNSSDNLNSIFEYFQTKFFSSLQSFEYCFTWKLGYSQSKRHGTLSKCRQDKNRRSSFAIFRALSYCPNVNPGQYRFLLRAPMWVAIECKLIWPNKLIWYPLPWYLLNFDTPNMKQMQWVVKSCDKHQ